MISLYLYAIIVTLITSWYFFKQKYHQSPPGPTGLPLIGNLLQLDKQMHLTFGKWSKMFPKIYKVDIATTRMIIVSDYKLVKEMFSSSTFSGRGGMKWIDIHTEGGLHGVINTDGEEWEQLRRFTLRQLRDFGFGKHSGFMESQIMEEVKELMEWMKSHEGKPIGGVKEKFVIAVVNSLWSIISGTRYSHDDPILLDLSDRLQKAMSNIAESGGLLIFAPWLRYIIPEKSGFNYIRKVLNDLRIFFTTSVMEHKKSLQNDQPRDFIDAFLTEIEKAKDNNSAFHGKNGDRQLIGCIADLFSAGTDTTSATLAWTILYLVTYPEIQKTFQKEIELATGNSRHCTLSDRVNMPYTEALIAEVMRDSSIVSMSVHHRAMTNNAQFEGYDISQDSIILANLHYIHHDPTIWGDDAQKFKPERFLSPDGKKYQTHEALMPFSIGKRQCIGESLAKDSIFLFATNIFQTFWIELDPSEPHPGTEPAVGMMLNPKPFKIILTDRQKT